MVVWSTAEGQSQCELLNDGLQCGVWIDERCKKYVEGPPGSFGQMCQRFRLGSLSFISFRPGVHSQGSTGLQKREVHSGRNIRETQLRKVGIVRR
jgi:hypothetical protein